MSKSVFCNSLIANIHNVQTGIFHVSAMMSTNNATYNINILYQLGGKKIPQWVMVMVSNQ